MTNPAIPKPPCPHPRLSNGGRFASPTSQIVEGAVCAACGETLTHAEFQRSNNRTRRMSAALERAERDLGQPATANTMRQMDEMLVPIWSLQMQKYKLDLQLADLNRQKEALLPRLERLQATPEVLEEFFLTGDITGIAAHLSVEPGAQEQYAREAGQRRLQLEAARGHMQQQAMRALPGGSDMLGLPAMGEGAGAPPPPQFVQQALPAYTPAPPAPLRPVRPASVPAHVQPYADFEEVDGEVTVIGGGVEESMEDQARRIMRETEAAIAQQTERARQRIANLTQPPQGQQTQRAVPQQMPRREMVVAPQQTQIAPPPPPPAAPVHCQRCKRVIMAGNTHCNACRRAMGENPMQPVPGMPVIGFAGPQTPQPPPGPPEIRPQVASVATGPSVPVAPGVPGAPPPLGQLVEATPDMIKQYFAP